MIPTVEQEIIHDNHYVSQFYLRNWSSDRKTILCYQILVPDAEVVFWKRRSIRSTARVTDLYSIVTGASVSDEFERWIAREFEQPASLVIAKLSSGQLPTISEMNNLVRFLALQDVRTPKNFIEQRRNVERWLPEITEAMTEELLTKLQTGDFPAESRQIHAERKPDMDWITPKVTASPPEAPNHLRINVTANFDRDAWIQQQERVLTTLAHRLLSHSWGIVEATPGIDWFTSDHPVVRLNYVNENYYDLRGGWDKEKGNVFMPLTPRHLLFTQMGDPQPPHSVFETRKTHEINKIIVEGAFRSVFSTRKINRVKRIKPRIVDPGLYQTEREFWNRWRI